MRTLCCHINDLLGQSARHLPHFKSGINSALGVQRITDMRIVIQDRQTGHYLHDMGGWTRNLHDARDFLCSADAIRARQTIDVAEALLVFRFEREGYSIAVPLEPQPTPTPAPAPIETVETETRPTLVPA